MLITILNILWINIVLLGFLWSRFHQTADFFLGSKHSVHSLIKIIPASKPKPIQTSFLACLTFFNKDTLDGCRTEG